MAPLPERSTANGQGLTDLNIDPSIKFGKMLARPRSGDEIVISGISGAYPDSKNVHELRDNLYNKIDMISSDNGRWKHSHPETPKRTGRVPNIERFDAAYFGIHPLQATCMDPMVRLILEKAVEAIFDAGINPSDLEGTNTGVFVGSNVSETEKAMFYDNLVPHGNAVTGCTRSMQARRISYFLKLKGPSFVCDSACSSSFYALEYAYRAIRSEKCDRAIVGGTNLCLHSNMSLQFARLGILSFDGQCKVFDNSGNGYARSEAITVIVLQKYKEAKRNYASVVHAKTNCDGYKDSGITYPSTEMQKQLYRDFYAECDFVKPTDLSYLEAHGTGTKVGDPEELLAIEEVFLKKRNTPLLIGSLKSNMGHTEPASGLCSIAKAIFAFETGYLPPNLHYNTPKAGIQALEDGRLKVVTEKMLINEDPCLIGISNYGFGGANSHVLLKQNPKHNTKHTIPDDNIPRLVCVSGRTRKAVNILLDDVFENNYNKEHIGLLQEVFRKNVVGHKYRGYALATKSGIGTRSCSINKKYTHSLIVCFGIIDNDIKRDLQEFMELPLVATTIHRLNGIFYSKGHNISEILSKTRGCNILEQILANFIFQIIFVDVLKALDIVPDKIIGINNVLSLGNLVSAYFHGVLDLKEVVNCAYEIAKAANSVGIKEDSDGIRLTDLIEKNKKIVNPLQYEFQKIIPQLKTTNKKAVLEGTSNEISEKNIMNCFGLIDDVSSINPEIRNNSVIYEIGDGSTNKVLTKVISNLDKKLLVKINGGFHGWLISLGRLYELGFNPQVQKLYPQVAFPVSRGTPMISPKINWNHNRKWWVMEGSSQDSMDTKETNSGIILKFNISTFITGQVIHTTGYLFIVWEIIADINGLDLNEMKVIFENCKFNKACSVPKAGKEKERQSIVIKFRKESGDFEVIQDGEQVVTGRVTQFGIDKIDFNDIALPINMSQTSFMNRNDIYQELRLRGYNYNDQSRCLQSYDLSTQIGQITWTHWVPFMDSMMQLKILQEDTRLCYVPATIQRLVIDATRHMDYIRNCEIENPTLSVHIDKETGILRSGFIEIKGLTITAIPKRIYSNIPLLEKYVFVPNVGKLSIEQAIKVNMQILLENICRTSVVKIVELIDEKESEEFNPLGDLILKVMADQPLVKPHITLRTINSENKNDKLKVKEILADKQCHLVVGSRILQKKYVLHGNIETFKENGFILCRESTDFNISSYKDDTVTIITVFTTVEEKLILLKKNSEFQTPKVVSVSLKDKEFTWLPKLKNALGNDGSVLILAQGEPENGALGLFTSLKKEPGNENVKLVFLPDPSSPEFHPELPCYKEQLKKNLASNVFKNGRWGSYRYLLLEHGHQKVDHCYLNSDEKGDLSSLQWIEGPLKVGNLVDTKNDLVSIYYASLTFKDILIATGNIEMDNVTKVRRKQEHIYGIEYAGRNQKGKRVMGIVPHGACASIIKVDKNLIWNVPEDWSLAEAATVPVAYGTCMYALFMKSRMQRGSTVLIHSGAGGVGQAAITIALHTGCIVYTTVGTPKKREFLKKKFPQLTDKNIASSRDTSFEHHIMSITNGRGVDIVLNSLSKLKLLASITCLARGGTFLEIGKFDISNDHKLNLMFLEKDASFHGISMDSIFYEHVELKLKLFNMIQEGINSGVIKPLHQTIFKMDDQEKAFRYMKSGKHIGKVLLKIRNEESEKVISPYYQTYLANSRYYCDNDKTYIICGGLGGFGLELADWLVLRGCRKLVLTSRTKIRTGYQSYRLSIWKSLSCIVQISTEDMTTEEGCQNLINQANLLGPVHAIFNLAVILKDALLENQTDKYFEISFGCKAYATHHLDVLSRESCPKLRDFVVFSSITSGRGFAGQTNYGMSNSAMERICEKRIRDGFPGLTIQWGAIADVGIMTKLKAAPIEIEGSRQQSITSCLKCMDIFLKQTESATVSSFVVADKRTDDHETKNILKAVANLLGVKDVKTMSLQSTLSEIGMDSIISVQIRETLKKGFGLSLSVSEIGSMTLTKLMELQKEKEL